MTIFCERAEDYEDLIEEAVAFGDTAILLRYGLAEYDLRKAMWNIGVSASVYEISTIRELVNDSRLMGSPHPYIDSSIYHV